MTASGTVAAGDLATAAQYNNLRTDVLDTSAGHRHDESDSRKLATLDTATGHTHNGTDSRVAALPYYNDKLGANVTLTNANQYYTVLSRSLVAGTWIIWGQVTMNAASQLRLSNGSTTYYAHAQTGAANHTAGITAVAVLGSTTTMTLQAAATSTGGTALKQITSNADATDDATQMTCVRVA